MVNQKALPKWLTWSRAIQAIAQTGLHFSENEFDRQRYQQLSEIAAQITAQFTAFNQGELLANFQLDQGYATPKVDVRGAVINPQGELLMVREKIDGGWTLPGGWADIGDAPSAAVEREIWEETGYRAKSVKLVGVYDTNRDGELRFRHAYKLLFLCELIGGEAATSTETTEVGWYLSNQIPLPFSGERTRQRHIDDAYAAFADPTRLTLFD